VEVPPPPPAPITQPVQPSETPAPAIDAGQREAARKQAEELARQKAAEAARLAEVETARRQAEDERRRLQAEVDAARKQVEELRLAKPRNEEQRQQEANQAAAAHLKAEAERKRREEEALQARIEEQRRQEEARKAAEAAQAKARAAEAARKQADDLARQKAAETARTPEPGELQRQVTQRLLDNGIAGLTVAVASDRSVRLTGAVESTQKRDQAVKLASAIAGVARVRDRMFIATGCREPAPAPRYYTGEKWTFQNDKGGEWTDAVISEGDVTQIQTAKGDRLFYDRDRILQKVVQSSGKILIKPDATAYPWLGKKTLDFPLRVGKNWQYQLFEQNRNYINRSSIVTCEAVTTPAGKLEAFKIEVQQSQLGSGNNGVYYLWYAPQVKNYIKRQYVPSQWWSASHRDYELIRYQAD
jgi:osmotically-inducible protein OsmY